MDTANNPPLSYTLAQLAANLGKPACPLILDVRKAEAFEQSSQCLSGALRLAPQDLPAAAAALPQNRKVVVYCVHGHEVGQDASQALRTAGLDAYYLQGGFEAWKQAAMPMMNRMPDLALPASAGRHSTWVTRERPKIDRIACPWLIRRFIDPGARFLYVPASDVLTTAAQENALPYDVPGVRFSHRGSQGERCSFDALMEDFGLNDPCLAALTSIVRGADTGQPALTPQSAGLLAVSLGLSVNYPDDHAMLAQGMVVYDALYAWLRSARTEAHNANLFKQA